MKKFICIISVLVLCSFQPENEKFVSKKAGFSIEVPKGYRAEKSSDEMVPVTIYSPKKNKKDDFIENISVVAQPFEGDGDSYYNAYYLGMFSLLDDYKAVDNGSRTIHGQKAHWAVYTFAYNGYTAKILAYYFGFNGKGYAITCSAKEDTFDKYQKAFTEIAESFKQE